MHVQNLKIPPLKRAAQNLPIFGRFDEKPKIWTFDVFSFFGYKTKKLGF